MSGDKAPTPADFMPSWGGTRTEQTPEEMVSILRDLAMRSPRSKGHR